MLRTAAQHDAAAAARGAAGGRAQSTGVPRQTAAPHAWRSAGAALAPSQVDACERHAGTQHGAQRVDFLACGAWGAVRCMQGRMGVAQAAAWVAHNRCTSRVAWRTQHQHGCGQATGACAPAVRRAGRCGPCRRPCCITPIVAMILVADGLAVSAVALHRLSIEGGARNAAPPALAGSARRAKGLEGPLGTPPLPLIAMMGFCPARSSYECDLRAWGCLVPAGGPIRLAAW